MSEQIQNDVQALAEKLEELEGIGPEPEPWSSEETVSLLQRLVPGLKAGMTLPECLLALEEEAAEDEGRATPPCRLRLRQLRVQIERGESLSAGLQQRQAPPVMVAFVRAGEVGGTLDRSVSSLLDYLAEEERLQETPVDPQWVTTTQLSLWCRLLGSLLEAGVPVLHSLELVAGRTTSPALREATLYVRASVREGGTFSEPMGEYPFFPSLLRRMIAAGERLGNLHEILLDLAARPEVYRTLGPGYPAELPSSPPLAKGGTGGVEAEEAGPEPISPPSKSDVLIQDNDAPIIRITNSILQQALQERATDLHIEPAERHLRVRYRVDGALREMMTMPLYVHPALVSRFKIMADLDPTERQAPQRGRIRIRHQGQDYDLRVATYAFAHGEHVVIRVHRPSEALLSLSEVGLTDGDRSLCEAILHSPCGLVVVTGPQGAGRSTTLYALLHHVAHPEHNVVTLENPVERRLRWVHQTNVDERIGLTYAASLRALTEGQDADVVMVSELRDAEAAREAINVVLGGRLVLTALTQPDTLGALEHLLHLGVEPFLLTSSLIGVIAQRLVRKTCDVCQEESTPSASERETLRRLGATEEEIAAATFTHGRGCPACNGMGYRGRTAIFELLDLRRQEDLPRLLLQAAPRGELQAALRAAPFRPLARDAARKCLAGVTTIAEAARVVE